MKSMVLFSDSTLAGTQDIISHPSQLFSHHLMTFSGLRVIDLSVPGAMLTRYTGGDIPFGNHLPFALSDHLVLLDRLWGLDFAVCLLGANDIKSFKEEYFLKNEVRLFCTRCIELTIKPIIISPIPIYNIYPVSDRYNYFRISLDMMVSSRPEILHIRGDSLVDYTNPDFYNLPDDEHLSVTGHGVMAYRFWEIVKHYV